MKNIPIKRNKLIINTKLIMNQLDGNHNLKYGYSQISCSEQYCSKCQNKKKWLYQPCIWNNLLNVCASCFYREEIKHRNHKKMHYCG